MSLEQGIRYDRNVQLWGSENQQRLQEAKVLLRGTGPLAQKAALSLVSLGIGTLTLIGDELMMRPEPNEPLIRWKASSSPKKAEVVASSLEDFIDKDSQRIIGYSASPDPLFLDFIDPDIIIDTTHDPDSKHRLAYHATGRGKPFLSAGSSLTDFYVKRWEPGQGLPRMLDLEDPLYRERAQGSFPSSLAAGILSNMVRRHYVALPQESGSRATKESHLYSGSDLLHLRTDGSTRQGTPFLDTLDCLVVGTGGIGNFLALDLGLMGVRSIDLVDMDTVEEHNLNRQPLLAGGVGQHKAEVVARRVRQLMPEGEVRPFTSRFLYDGWSAAPQGLRQRYDLIFSCVDNDETRVMVNDYAVANRTRLVSGRLGPDWGQVTIYVPGGTRCVDCQENTRAALESPWEEPAESPAEQGGCQAHAQPNIVIPNIMVAGALIGQGLASIYHPSTFSERTPPLRYTSLGLPALAPGTYTLPFDKGHRCGVGL